MYLDIQYIMIGIHEHTLERLPLLKDWSSSMLATMLTRNVAESMHLLNFRKMR